MPQLQRTLSFKATYAIVVGSVIGSGVFMKPAVMAGQLGSAWLLILVWIIAGLITLFGALSNAEAAAMFPETGGQYIFFQKMYGEGFAFVYGWSAFAVFNTAGNASIAYVCAQYTEYFVQLPRFSQAMEQSLQLPLPLIGSIYPLENIGVKSLTIALVVLFTAINYFSVRYGSGLQRILTALKVLAIVLVVLGILFSGKGNWQNLQSTTITELNWLTAFMAAMAGAFWAYDGWNNITFIAGEVREPQRHIPKSLLFGLLTCIAIYVLINLAFVYVLPLNAMTQSSFVASDAGKIALGTIGGGLIALLVILSTLGTTNANILSTARVTFALGKASDRLGWIGRVQPRYQTPGNALWLNAGWSILLIFSGSFDMLTDMLIFVSWFFYGMSALGIIRLRKTMPDAVRPYRVWAYPWPTVVFVLFTAVFLVATLYTDIQLYQQGKTHLINAAFGMLIAGMGIPLYFISRKQR
jgi:APA family basic amino acid/polyamine antiporter